MPPNPKSLNNRTLLSPLRHHSGGGGGHHNWSGEEPDADLILHDLSHWAVAKVQSDPLNGSPDICPIRLVVQIFDGPILCMYYFSSSKRLSDNGCICLLVQILMLQNH